MTSVFAARRAAEEFAALVDGTRTDAADRYARLTDVAALLASQPRVEARPAFVADLRTRLMMAAELELAPVAPVLRAVPARTTTAPRPAQRPHRLGTAAAAALVVVGGSAGMAAAAQGALPGDGLYNVKRGIESVTTALSTGDADRGSHLLDRAGTRLDEVEALASAGADSARIAATLKDFNDAASQGASLLFRSYEESGRSGDISAVRDFAANQQAALAALGDLAPADARAAIEAATAQLDAIDTEALSLCAGCGGAITGTRFDDVTSSAALNALLSVPAAAIRPKAPRSQPAKAPSHSAATPSTSTQSQTTAPPAAPSGGETLPPAPTAPTNPVTSSITKVTQPVTDLVDQVGASTGLGAVTSPLTGLINSLGQ